MTQPSPAMDVDGLAALGICESLLIALTEQKIITEKAARELLTDVATTHSAAASQSLTPGKHLAVVEIIKRILSGRNGSVPHEG